ncbi:MAG: crossover junction endodeoxyribonuclease RuvC [Aeriscardovia sp.]|nr:crossover junction endodeoxyribonuclease RuvC [Aeriscardovia sp.]MBP5785773.1 crossover junction endodeoxyribonuclease RuvC [Aeriscardovia sp.]MBQ1286559.1 crossover junction endodeoxyribonuclease RuvC [Aeriscardovia sp.]MBQ1301123.1 crossover junction endodeoxyribonuclease RuvC [Aeriscardovia sp.]MBQ5493450.1 crossover junction endodeoxyribonuclease RuvC [Aeriscardovia sp.]
MLVLGVDPGLTRCGIGAVEAQGLKMRFVEMRVLSTSPSQRQEDRLLQLYDGLREEISKFKPDIVSIEKVFAQKNTNTVLGTAQVAGLAMLVSAQHSLPTAMHTPTEVKLAVTGNGMATKVQIQRMVARFLSLPSLPSPFDGADALAQAICHILHPEDSSVFGLMDTGKSEAQKKWIEASEKFKAAKNKMRGRGM